MVHSGPLYQNRSDIIDFRNLELIRPASLTTAAIEIDRLLSEGRQPRFIAPSSHASALALVDRGFASFLDSRSVLHSLPMWAMKPDTLDVTSFGVENNVENLALRLHEWGAERDADLAAALYICLCEAGDNILFHSGRASGYFAAELDETDTLRFAIADGGVGMRTSLASLGPTDDLEALDLAMTSGVSATQEIGRGFGLASMSRYVLERGGTFAIMSGSAFRIEGPAGLVRRSLSNSAAGVLIQGILPTGREIGIEPVDATNSGGDSNEK
ncbi:ATP-binding protein [Agreia sp. VKM Ac-1783]|uniref:ATP-binding protein n=1 Tax=Agreia sp. VKM Ac-1783 TaxID=1938889 RepID=UPI001121FA16|nr:ATP-binding protein [Agreia sp. VKM Ac-1783]